MIWDNLKYLKLASEEENVLDNVCDSEEEELIYENSYYLPVLYNIDKSKKERMWKVWVTDDTVHRVQGLVDGKKQTYERSYKGKNIGKKNETSSHEQAKQTSETMWNKQIDKGYFPKCKEGKALLKKIQKSKIETGGHNINSAAAMRGRQTKTVTKKDNFIVEEVFINVKPMKAGVWEHDPENPRKVLPKTLKYFNLNEGFYMQYKLDGWRGIARLQLGERGEYDVVLTTNNGKQFPWFGNLRKQILFFILSQAKLLKKDPTEIILDGEFYTHVLYDSKGIELNDESRFSTISSMCGLARTEPHPLEDQLNYVVFDLVDLTGAQDQTQRFEKLKEMFKKKPEDCSHIIMCNTKIGHTVEDVIEYHDDVSRKGYEGVMIRSRDLKYIQKRSLYIRKYKYFIDREYPIVDVYKDEGVGDEFFVWVCHDPKIIDPNTHEPIRFHATPKGDRESKRYWYENYLEYIGKKACVKFQEYSQEKIPRFPVMIGIREDQ